MGIIDRIIFKSLNIERSYSQCGEDKILSHLFASSGKEKITYLDVGTNHPKIHNNTYLFYLRGGSGVCVEPNPAFASLIRSARPRDKCLSVGVSPGEDCQAEFFLMSSHTLSTFSKEDAFALEESGAYSIQTTLTIPIRNINGIIKDNFDKPPDLISLDVEGWNEEIVRSLDLDHFRPPCFCVETLTFSENGQGQKIRGILDVFHESGYVVFADTHINTIFVDPSSSIGNFK